MVPNRNVQVLHTYIYHGSIGETGASIPFDDVLAVGICSRSLLRRRWLDRPAADQPGGCDAAETTEQDHAMIIHNIFNVVVYNYIVYMYMDGRTKYVSAAAAAAGLRPPCCNGNVSDEHSIACVLLVAVAALAPALRCRHDGRHVKHGLHAFGGGAVERQHSRAVRAPSA